MGTARSPGSSNGHEDRFSPRTVPADRAAVRGGHSMREPARFRPGARRPNRAHFAGRGLRRCPVGHRGNQPPRRQAATLDLALRSSRRNSPRRPRGLPRPEAHEEPVRPRTAEHDVPGRGRLADRNHQGHLVRPPSQYDLHPKRVRPAALAPHLASLPLTEDPANPPSENGPRSSSPHGAAGSRLRNAKAASSYRRGMHAHSARVAHDVALAGPLYRLLPAGHG
jgi:hypothetical protein